ncbi:MAG: 6-pyruvoyl-tetrahydropterin synthase-related protein [Reyranellales bacterium]
MTPSRWTFDRPPYVTALVAVLLMAPSLLLGTLVSHSSPQDLTWASQFSEQFRAGILYPRWMPGSFDGLGSPAFYFYPPLPFWIDALVSVFTFNVLSVTYRLALTSTLILWGSGLAMHAWLAHVTPSRRTALVGAVVYMAAPYHLVDHYIRGAFAELTAYAVLPLVVLAFGLVADRRRGSTVLLAVAYAALLMSHLPTAMLATVTVLPLYVLYRERRPDALVRSAIGVALGIGLAAIYLAPALLLQGSISAHQFWTGIYYVENWFLVTPERWPDPDIMAIITLLAITYALAAACVCIFFRRMAEPFFWAGTCLFCLVLISGVVPWFWRLPELPKAQFPWRLMMVVEFTAITSLCLVPLKGLQRAAVYLLAGAFVSLAAAETLIVGHTAARIDYTRTHRPLLQQDVKEYEPRGYPQAPGLGYTQLALEPVADVPTIFCTPLARVCRAEPGRFGAMRIEIDNDTPTRVVLRRFYFPAWRADPLVPLAATERLRLVAFAVPAGHTAFTLDRVSLWAERIGWSLSGQAFLMLFVWGMTVRWSIKAA